MKILITGFEPIRQFYDINPSWEAVKKLPDKINEVEIVQEELPIVFDRAEQIVAAGLPAGLSETAGTHLCNHVTYFTSHWIKMRNLNTINGFIHVPLDMSQCLTERGTDRFFMSINVIAKALEEALYVIVEKVKK